MRGFKKEWTPITQLEVFQKGIITLLRGDQKVVQRLSDLGLIQNAEVELVGKTPFGGPVQVSVRRTTIAMARNIADNIFVVGGTV